MIGNFILFQSLTYRGFLLKATRGRLFSFFSVFFPDFNSHAWPQKAKKEEKTQPRVVISPRVAELCHAWHLSHAWPYGDIFGHAWSCLATRGRAGPPHVWLHEFDTRKKRRSHTWAIQTWSWSAASLQPRVATHGTWFSSTRSFLSSFSLLATRGRQLTLSHARGATRGHTGHAWRGSF